MSETKKTPDAWLSEPNYRGMIVMDPDGWDRRNFEKSWSEEITEAVFKQRLLTSTVLWAPSK